MIEYNVPVCYLCDSPIQPDRHSVAILIPQIFTKNTGNDEETEHQFICSACISGIENLRNIVRASGVAIVSMTTEGLIEIEEQEDPS